MSLLKKLPLILVVACFALPAALIHAPSASAATTCDNANPCLPQGQAFFSLILGTSAGADFGCNQSSICLIGNTSAANGTGVRGTGSGTNGKGVEGQGGQYGGYFDANDYGVYGTGNSYGGYFSGSTGVLGLSQFPGADDGGVVGQNTSSADNAAGTVGKIFSTSPGSGSAGVRGINAGTGLLGVGVWGSQAGSGYGVYGSTPSGTGVVGLHENASGTSPGVQGETNSTAGNAIGVLGRVNPTTAGPGSAGVRGINTGTGAVGVGVWGSQNGSGYGVYGTSPAGYGVVGQSNTGFAGYFMGNVFVNGTLSKAAGAFKIDNPLDPAHKYLSHSFVESPDMKDVYDGVATTDPKGFAVVHLPRYFQALNRSFRYQLTIVGHSFAQAIVWKEIADNRFTIRTNAPRVKVSWQVTGIRHDAYANAHRIKVVEDKPARAQGKYLQPQLYGQPASKAELRPSAPGPAPRPADWQTR
jgi:hypothetical protein